MSVNDAITAHLHGRLMRALARVEQVESSEAFIRAILDVTRGELEVERARVRRWQLRLRWRRTELQDDEGRVDVRELDRLLYRQVRLEEDGARLATDDTEMLDMTMHGPKPGRFLP